ncbi:hypothetical protein SPRG_18968, partial [Saprolegnia parasitica CBS 223.65]
VGLQVLRVRRTQTTERNISGQRRAGLTTMMQALGDVTSMHGHGVLCASRSNVELHSTAG